MGIYPFERIKKCLIIANSSLHFAKNEKNISYDIGVKIVPLFKKSKI